MSSDSEMPHKKDDMMLTKACLSEVMMPSQTNPSGNVHGGELMKMMDSTAYEAARKYCSANVVTARVDELEFHMPIRIGDLVTCTAEVIYVGNTSMEVAVSVEVEVLDSEQGPQHALSAYFTMVALDRNGRPTAVPPLEVEDENLVLARVRKRHESYHERKKSPKAS